jgi:oxygen-independent coproporphyrinogen-3 oxidase
LPDLRSGALSQGWPAHAAGEVSLYVHVPFCDVRCPYCHFACFVNRDAELFDRWAKGVVMQFSRMRAHFGVDRLASVYFGGGTPTALTPSARRTVTEWLGRELTPLLPDGGEVTLECNPESAWPESLTPWVEAGVNRLSVGIQSMDAGVLKFLGRLNTPESNRRVLDLACGTVDNVSADLIVASPADSPKALGGSLDEMLGWPITHVSAYLLEFHAATRFGRDLKAGRIHPKPDGEQAGTYRELVDRLAAAGFGAYELSNFAREGFEARHNRRYWTRAPYLGVGPSAHSNIGPWRWAEQRDTAPWIAAIEAGEMVLEDLERLGPAEIEEERLLLGLRLREGVEESLLAGREPLVDQFVAAGLLERRGQRLAATVDGWLLLDQIVARLCT